MNNTDEPILEQLKHSPRLPEHVDDLLAFLKEEQQKRQDFYEWLSDDVKAEFIDGKVVLHSPVVKKHNVTTKNLLFLLDACVDKFALMGFVGVEKILFKSLRNDYEPDICYFSAEKAVSFTDKTMFFPAPDFIVEIVSPSTEKIDRGVKFRDYAASDVREYWIIDPDSEIIEQYENRNGSYFLLLKVNSGTISSLVVPEFEIPVKAVFDEKLKRETLKKFL